MTSNKRRTTSKSGSSPKSTKKPGPSSRTPSSSATAPTSFAEVFGKEESQEVRRARQQLARATEELRGLRSIPEPTIALLRTRHKARLARLTKYVGQLEEYIQYAADAG